MGFGPVVEAPFAGPKVHELAPIIHDLPVAGFNRRFLASTLQLADGATVSKWPDISGSGTSLEPVATYAAAPTAATVDGITSVAFDGTSQGLKQNLTMNQPHSLVVVAKLRDAGVTGTRIIVGGQNGSDSEVENAVLGTAGTVPNKYVYLQGSLTGGTINGPTADQLWHVFVAVWDGANAVLSIDGAETLGSTGTARRDILTLGYHRAGQWTNMAAAEVLTYPQALTSTERSDLITTLRAKYGI